MPLWLFGIGLVCLIILFSIFLFEYWEYKAKARRDNQILIDQDAFQEKINNNKNNHKKTTQL